MKKLAVPEELKLENYDRRKHHAVFDRMDLVIDFRGGKDNIGATVKGFLDAITKHDEIVVIIEDQMKQISEFKRIYRKKNRLFRNLDSAWNLMLTNPVEFAEYLELLPKMKNIEERIEQVTDPEAKARIVSQFERYQILHPVCSKQLAVYEIFTTAREERDISMHTLVAAEGKLNKYREEEKLLAAAVCDDHVMADSLKKSMTAMFPNIHPGYILHSINNDIVEHLPYDQVVNRIRRAKSPHNAEFRRYDYRYNPFLNAWNSLEELRQLGVCIEDPLIMRMSFIAFAAKGDQKAVYDSLMQGEDPNCMDLTGNTALIVAAANQHPDVVDLLYKAGANINMRDKNMMTALLYCVNRGYVEMVRQLIDLGADKSMVDRNHRDIVFYAILSKNVPLVKWFLRKDQVNVPDKLWGFTPLHLAASQGDMAMMEFLLSMHASIYRLDLKQRTAEMVAKENGYRDLFERLRDERLNAPGQLVFENDSKTTQLWIGDCGAMEPVWCNDIEFSHVVYFRPEKTIATQYQWLKKDEDVKFLSFVVPMLDDDGDANDNWEVLQTFVGEIFEYFKVQSVQHNPFRVLICDDNGTGLAPGMAAILLLLREQIRIKDSVLHFMDCRPRVDFGPRIMKGMDLMQRAIDDKLMKRLNQRLRGSVANSIAF